MIDLCADGLVRSKNTQIIIYCLLQTSTDYGPYLANEPSPLHTTTIVERCTEKLVDDWNKMRANVILSPRIVILVPHMAINLSSDVESVCINNSFLGKTTTSGVLLAFSFQVIEYHLDSSENLVAVVLPFACKFHNIVMHSPPRDHKDTERKLMHCHTHRRNHT